jgi:hypothetical protein
VVVEFIKFLINILKQGMELNKAQKRALIFIGITVFVIQIIYGIDLEYCWQITGGMILAVFLMWLLED